MLHKSGENLESGAVTYIVSNETVTLFSAYLKLDELIRINTVGNIKQIIVRWDIEDLCRNISDISVYEYCKTNNIALFRNTRIHLKAFWNDNSDVLLGSANVTNKGLGEKGNFNFELNGIVNEISFRDKSYLNKLILESEYVTQELYVKLKNIIETTMLPTFDFPKLPTPSPAVDYFLINQLPMTSSPEVLYEIYSGNIMDETEMNCASHDLELYCLPNELGKEEFLNQLKVKFNAHPFIIAFKGAVQNSKDDYGRTERDGSMKFGAVRKWFSDNTTTVPTPRPFELTDYCNILYEWICIFDSRYTCSVPGARSNVIKYQV